MYSFPFLYFFFFNDTATTEIYTLSLHDALPISAFGQQELAQQHGARQGHSQHDGGRARTPWGRSEEHTSELQSHSDLVCRLLLEKKKNKVRFTIILSSCTSTVRFERRTCNRIRI